jgi:pantoate--beta-alanine ligase
MRDGADGICRRGGCAQPVAGRSGRGARASARLRICRSPARLQAFCLDARRRGVRIGFVPTMGALHRGHLALVRCARMRADLVVVSIFVNRTQFGPGEDFGAYPRDLRRDLDLLRAAGVDIVFCPADKGMYAPDASTFVDETVLARGLCGRSRPGHFRGVTTVVAKLFNIVQPTLAVFGRKDAQQALVVRRMVRDLNFPVRVVVAPTVREPGGLALSSRNAYLSPDEREDARCLSRALRGVRSKVRCGERDVKTLCRQVAAVVRRHARLEYVSIVDAETLAPLDTVDRRALVALAARVGRTRLIDNAVVSPAF